MKTTAILLIGFLGISGVGCATCSNSKRPDGVAVTVYIDVNGKKATTSNKTVYLCKDKDWVEWVSSTGDVQEPRFDKKSPFDKRPERVGKKLKSGIAKEEGRFEYKIQVLLRDGAFLDVDPIIEVMP